MVKRQPADGCNRALLSDRAANRSLREVLGLRSAWIDLGASRPYKIPQMGGPRCPTAARRKWSLRELKTP